MLYKRRPRQRYGTTAVEAAFVFPVFFLLLFGILVGGMGVFRFQEVASLAREGSRWASVHGTQYATDTGNAAASASDVYNNAILPKVVSLNNSSLTYSVTWSPNNQPGSNVTVTVSYQWLPEVYLVGPITLTSTSKVAMSY
jgi:Flp pilus assembly protein TadG